MFLVQGEGRGHMTQAVSLKKRLEKDGHQVRAGVGINPRRNIPEFFSSEFGEGLFRYQSPNFITDQKQKGLQIGKSIWVNLLMLNTYLKELKRLKRETLDYAPNAIINFYEPLGGLLQAFNRISIPTYGIGHQFLLLHPDFEMPKSSRSDRISLQNFTRLTGMGCKRYFGLSFYDMPARGKIIPVPPLLRETILKMEKDDEGFFLVYLLNPGYIEEVKKWSKENPGTKICCFTDSLVEDTQKQESEDLTLYGLSGTNFLKLLSKCRGLITTAGFESVCEAMYLEKPVMMVPVKNHFEQFVNSRDGYKAGAGIYSDHFDFDGFLSWIEQNQNTESSYKNWVEKNQDKLVHQLYSDLNSN